MTRPAMAIDDGIVGGAPLVYQVRHMARRYRLAQASEDNRAGLHVQVDYRPRNVSHASLCVAIGSPVARPTPIPAIPSIALIHHSTD